MTQFENKVIAKYKKQTKPIYFRKFHGNKYQADFPDTVFVFEKGGEPRYLEFKVSLTRRVPWSVFKLGQHLECLKMAAAGFDVKYAIYVKADKKLYYVPIFMVKEGEHYDIHQNTTCYEISVT